MDKLKVALGIISTLHQKGFEAYLAGGCVRDRLRGVTPKDFDIATSAHPEDIRKLFKKTIPVGAQFGVMLVLEDEITFEVATFRNDGEYVDGRHPGQVTFTTVEEDAKRRDFTVNGLYWDLKKNEVLDFVGGQEDLKNGVIRTIGNPTARFKEDHLRMLRAVRFSVQLGFEIASETKTAIKENAALIASVSAERIRDELSKSLITANPAGAIRLMDEFGLLPHFLPEVMTLKGVEQPMEYHPEGDVFIHTMLLLEKIPNPPLELALGALFHDIAKPATFVRAVDRIRFHGHDRIGAEMTETILRRLTFSNEMIKVVCSLVAEHLRFKDAFQMRVATLKRFLSLPRFDLHLELHRIDCLSSHGSLDAYHFCKGKYEEFLQTPPPPLKLVRGEDLIKLGYDPGPQFAKMIEMVEDAILEGTVKTKEDGIALVERNFPRGQS